MEQHRAAIWTLVGIIVGFKFGTLLVILIYAWPADGQWGVLLAMHWPFVLPIVLLIAGPTLFWLRLLRVRAKRQRLQRSEWEVS